MVSHLFQVGVPELLDHFLPLPHKFPRVFDTSAQGSQGNNLFVCWFVFWKVIAYGIGVFFLMLSHSLLHRKLGEYLPASYFSSRLVPVSSPVRHTLNLVNRETKRS